MRSIVQGHRIFEVSVISSACSGCGDLDKGFGAGFVPNPTAKGCCGERAATRNPGAEWHEWVQQQTEAGLLKAESPGLSAGSVRALPGLRHLTQGQSP